MDVSIAVAFAAGFVSFASPCVLALLPIYIAFLGDAAVSPIDAHGGPTAGSAAATAGVSLLPQALLFVLGFTALFVLLGTSLGLLGSALFRVNEVRQAAGIGVMILGVLTTGVFGPVFERVRVGVPFGVLPAARSARSVSLGALVAVGWTPCIGPVLGAIFTMGAATGSAAAAAILLIAYSAGMAVPFLAAALALPRMQPLLDALRRHHRAIQVVAGLFIIAIGVLIYLNAFARLAGFFIFVL